MNKNSYLAREIEAIGHEKNYQNTEYNRNLEERVALLSQEIERLNLILTQSTSKIDEVSRNELVWQEKYHNKENEFLDLREQFFRLESEHSLLYTKYQEVLPATQPVNTTRYE